MPDEELDVYLDGRHVGALAQSAQGNVTFHYDSDYRNTPGATPLSLSMPLTRADHKNRATKAYIAGLLPDSAGRLRQLSEIFRTPSVQPFALLSRTGRDAAGAVQIMPKNEASPDAAQRRGDLEVHSDESFAAIVSDVVRNADTWGRRDPNIRWSLPGAQPKMALFRTEDGYWATPRDSTPTTHIFKPAVPPYPDHHINALVMMQAARYLGLDVARDFTLETVAGDAVYVSERYDRVQKDGRWARLHQEDLCQAMGLLPDKKYQEHGGPSINQVAQLLRQLPILEDARTSARRFFDAIVFNTVALGTDAHAKNYSLLLDGESVRLAPLYDLGTHAVYPVREGGAMKAAMAVDGEYAFDKISRKQLIAAASKLGIRKEEAGDRIHHIRTNLADAFHDSAERVQAEHGPNEFADRLAEAIEKYTGERGWRTTIA